MNHSIRKALFLILGTVSLGVGVIGIFLPVLPTTPLLLLASFCYLRSSKKLHHWLITHKVFGAYIYHYITYKAVLKKTKYIALLLLWASLVFSMFIVPFHWIRFVLLIIGISVSIHLYSLKTITMEDIKAHQNQSSDNQIE